MFHFLTETDDRRRYVAHMRRAVRLGGAAVIAAFALDGPGRCSGLPVARYSPETLGAEIGREFRLSESPQEQHYAIWNRAVVLATPCLRGPEALIYNFAVEELCDDM